MSFTDVVSVHASDEFSLGPSRRRSTDGCLRRFSGWERGCLRSSIVLHICIGNRIYLSTPHLCQFFAISSSSPWSSPPLGHPFLRQKWSASPQHHISAHTSPLWMIYLLLACACLCRRAHAKIIPVGPVGEEKFDRPFFRWGNLTDPAPIAPFGLLF